LRKEHGCCQLTIALPKYSYINIAIKVLILLHAYMHILEDIHMGLLDDRTSF
jgi:hypothetical protein